MHFEALNGANSSSDNELSLPQKRKALRGNNEKKNQAIEDCDVVHGKKRNTVTRLSTRRTAKLYENLNENRLVEMAITSIPSFSKSSKKRTTSAATTRWTRKHVKTHVTSDCEESSESEENKAHDYDNDSDSESDLQRQRKGRRAPTGRRSLPKRSVAAATVNYYENDSGGAEQSTDSDDDGMLPMRQKVVGSSNTSSSPVSGMDIATVDSAGESDSDSSMDSSASNIHYHIQSVLASRTMTQREWRSITDTMNTHEIARGSVWKSTEREYFDNSDRQVEKFLIKWTHCSYLHVSWETESDLLELVGPHAKRHLETYRQRMDRPLFEDLGLHEYFPKSFITIDRILDITDDGVAIDTIDPDAAVHPKYRVDEGKMNETDDSVKETTKNKYLHTPQCYLTVKWEGLAYVDSTFEDVNDLYRYNVHYIPHLRFFYSLQQSKPCKRVRRQHIKLDEIETPNGQLRDYQKTGVQWLYFNWLQKRNSILADEMGLGKTIQCAVFVEMLHQKQNLTGPFLIIVPLSTLVHWKRELQTWTTLDVVVYYGSHEDRSMIYDFEFQYMTKPKDCKLQILLTTYESIINADSKGRRPLNKIDWHLAIIDEAHRLKNYQSKLYIALVNNFNIQNNVLLTGTPLQNNTEELWTLLHFVNPVEFPCLDTFIEEFGNLTDSSQLSTLHSKLQPYILRRLKSVVDTTIPIKQEILIQVELTSYQKRYYKAIFERNRDFLYQGSKSGPQLTNITMELRKCCNHLFLVKNAEDEVKKLLENSVVNSSSKVILLDKLLHKLRNDGHKVLIFSQFKIMLDILEEYLYNSKFSYSRIDGDIIGRNRQYVIDKYTTSDIFVMLLSTKAGGVGINLTAADTVIIYDNSFNPQDDIQAMARVHRIGQSKPVTIYRFLTKNTYEMFMFDIASKKLGLNYAIMNDIEMNASSGRSTALTKKEIENLLRFGAYDIFNNAEADDSITNESIDHILEHCSTVIESKGASEKNGFSKAVFVTGNEETVNMNDPHFWEKLLPAMEQPKEERKMRRRAECNYKEASIYEESSSYEGDSDNERSTDTSLSKESLKSAENVSKGRPRKNAFLSWTPTKLNRLLSLVLRWGYPNFHNMCRHGDFGKRCTPTDIAVGSRWVMLGMLRYVVSRSDGFCHRLMDGKIQEVAVTEDSRRYEDLINMKLYFAKSKACRLLVHVLCHCSDINVHTEDNLLRDHVTNMKNGDASFLTRLAITDEELVTLWAAFENCPFEYHFKRIHRLRSLYLAKFAVLDDLLDAYTLMLTMHMHIEPKPCSPVAKNIHIAYNPYVHDILEFLAVMLPEEEAPAKWWYSIDDLVLLMGIVKFGLCKSGKFDAFASIVMDHHNTVTTVSDVIELYRNDFVRPAVSKNNLKYSSFALSRRLEMLAGVLRGAISENISNSTTAIACALIAHGRPYDIYNSRKGKGREGMTDACSLSTAGVVADTQSPSSCFITWEKLQALLPIRISLENLKGRVAVITDDIELMEETKVETIDIKRVLDCVAKKQIGDIKKRVEQFHSLRLMLLAASEKLDKVLLQACYSDEAINTMMSLPTSWTHIHDRNVMRLTCAFGWSVCRVGVTKEGQVVYSEPYEIFGEDILEVSADILSKRLNYIVTTISINAPVKSVAATMPSQTVPREKTANETRNADEEQRSLLQPPLVVSHRNNAALLPFGQRPISSVYMVPEKGRNETSTTQVIAHPPSQIFTESGFDEPDEVIDLTGEI